MIRRYPHSLGFATAIVHTIFQVESVGRLNQSLPTTKLFNRLTYKDRQNLPANQKVRHLMFY